MDLMEYENTPLDFLMDVMEEEKKLFHRIDIKMIEIKDWPEFTSRRSGPMPSTTRTQLYQYILEQWGLDVGDCPPEKAYVWAILCTLEPEFNMWNMNDIWKKRNAHRDSAVVNKPPDIAISAFWQTKLLSMPFDPRKYFLSLQPHRLFPKQHSLQLFFV